MAYVPSRGDVVWLQFNPQAGHEQAGHRPAVILSPQSYNEKVGLAIVCPITSQRKGYPFEVVLPDEVTVTGVVLADQVKRLDWRVRNATFQETLPEGVMAEILAKLGTLLD
ncbi:MAG TPA: endoribonuclease MazF [Caldilineaceae bacterium]|nr:endoribonuclease MazF [Caldilineaceae bacterium]